MINTIASIWGKNMLGFFVLGHVFLKAHFQLIFLELHSWKTVCFSEQIMSADKYPSMFPHQIEAVVYLVSPN